MTATSWATRQRASRSGRASTALGSCQQQLWGINLYPAEYNTDDFIEFDSMINLRPSQGNRTRSVDDAATRQTIVEIVTHLVQSDD